MTQRKRIILIEPVGGHGGMDYYDYGLAVGLVKNGCHVDFFTCKETIQFPHDHISRHNSFGCVWTSKWKIIKFFRFINGYWQAFRYAKRVKANTVHLHLFDIGWLNQLVLLLGCLYSKHLVVTLHDISTLSGKTQANSASQLRRVRGIIVHNQYSYEVLISQFPELKHKTTVLNHGSYVEFVSPVAPFNVPMFSKENPFELLFFGQIKPTKGLTVLLKAMRHLETEGIPVHLTIAGKPWQMREEEINDLIAVCNSLSSVSYLFQYVPNDEVHTYFERAHLIILPYEQIYQSGVLLLSMSYGRSVLCSDLPAFSEVLKDDYNGFLFEKGNAKALAEKIRAIYFEPYLLKNVEINMKQSLDADYSWTKIAEKTVNFYNEFVK